MEELANAVYRSSVHSDCPDMQSTELYLIRGAGRSLLIDTGYCVDSSAKTVYDMLDALQICPADLDVFLTHNHPDHAGLAWALSKQGAVLYMHPEERHTCALICSYYENTREQSVRRLKFYGYDQREAEQVIQGALQAKYRYHDYHRTDFPFRPILPGQQLRYGDYQLEAVALPGHTKHQLGLAERRNKWLFAGDTLARDQIFIISATVYGERLLQSQMETLRRLQAEFSDYWIAPGHPSPFSGVGQPAASAVRYFQKLARRILTALVKQPQWTTVRELMDRLFGYRENALPREESLKLHFRMANTLACLEWLTDHHFLEEREADGMHFWNRTNPSPAIDSFQL